MCKQLWETAARSKRICATGTGIEEEAAAAAGVRSIAQFSRCSTLLPLNNEGAQLAWPGWFELTVISLKHRELALWATFKVQDHLFLSFLILSSLTLPMFATLASLARAGRASSASGSAANLSPASVLLNGALQRLLSSSKATDWTVLGLDISTRVIGMAVLSAGGELLATQALKATPAEHPYKIAAAVSEAVSELHEDFGLGHVAIEDILKSFSPGRFHTQGLFKLSALNGTIGYECWRRTKGGASVETYMPNAIRAAFPLLLAGRSAAAADAVSAMMLKGTIDIEMPDGEVMQVKVRGAGVSTTTKKKDGSGDDGSADSPASVLPTKATAAGPGKDEAVKIAVLQFVTRLYPDLAETWAVTRTGTLDKSNYDRSDAVLVALYGLMRKLEKAMILSSYQLLRRYAAAVGFDAEEAVATTASGTTAGTKAGSSRPRSRSKAKAPSPAPTHDASVVDNDDGDNSNDDASLSPAWRAFKRLHERTMREEAEAAGQDAESESAEEDPASSAPPADDGTRSSDEEEEDGDQDEGDGGGGLVARPPAKAAGAPKKKREPPVFEGLTKAQAERLTEAYQKLRQSFSEDFRRVFLEQLVEKRIAANDARKERARAKRNLQHQQQQLA